MRLVGVPVAHLHLSR